METGMIYGRIPVYEYLKSDLVSATSTLFIQDTIKKSQISQIISEASKAGIRIEYRDKKFLSKQSGGENHQGILLSGTRLFHDLDRNDYADIARNNGVIVLLDQITDPHNAGAIIRSAEALGASGVIIPAARQAPVNSVAIKSAAGATAHIPVGVVSNLAQEIDQLQKGGFWIAGSSDHGQTDPGELHSIRPLGIVIGSEGDGMRNLTEKKCDYICRIPMQGKVSSLNASVASGILLYKALIG
jgi:23S rRNA (guanosine2251-2'-O)-methyltransferase